MVRLGRRRRDVLAQTFRELGNLVVGVLVLGQFVQPTVGIVSARRRRHGGAVDVRGPGDYLYERGTQWLTRCC